MINFSSKLSEISAIIFYKFLKSLIVLWGCIVHCLPMATSCFLAYFSFFRRPTKFTHVGWNNKRLPSLSLFRQSIAGSHRIRPEWHRVSSWLLDSIWQILDVETIFIWIWLEHFSAPPSSVQQIHIIHLNKQTYQVLNKLNFFFLRITAFVFARCWTKEQYHLALIFMTQFWRWYPKFKFYAPILGIFFCGCNRCILCSSAI